jgi:hypothetical protein
MTNVEIHPADVLMHLIVSSLTPMFLAASGGDPDRARTAIVEIVNAHTVRTPADLLPIAQIIAFGLALLSSVSLSMSENIPIPLILRLRSNAASLNRGAEHCRRALREAPAPGSQPPSAAPCRPAEFPDAECRVEQAVIAEVARTQRRVADHQAKLGAASETTAAPAIFDAPIAEAPPTRAAAMDALAADSQRRIDQAEAALRAPSLCVTESEPRHTSMTGEEADRVAWSNAMADVAREVTADIARLPPSERRAAGIRAAALASAANDLLIRAPAPSPLNPKRPSAP